MEWLTRSQLDNEKNSADQGVAQFSLVHSDL